MTQPRHAQVSRADTPYYHCLSRCVRRAYLCGQDPVSGQCYEHRRGWIRDRLHILSSLFTIDICAYAVMNNHYHLVVKLHSSDHLSDEAVMERWLTLFKGPLLVQRHVAGHALSPAQRDTVADITRVWRNRLQDLSWFMKCLNEPIARQANQEDACTGHFWEARFKSQALRTEQALLSCMAYVDLNPIRAGMANTPETSDYTSIQARIQTTVNPVLHQAVVDAQGLQRTPPLPLRPLAPFAGTDSPQPHTGVPFTWKDYLALVDWTGRQVRRDKRGVIASNLPPMLNRLDSQPDDWLIQSLQFEAVFRRQFATAVKASFPRIGCR